MRHDPSSNHTMNIYSEGLYIVSCHSWSSTNATQCKPTVHLNYFLTEQVKSSQVKTDRGEDLLALFVCWCCCWYRTIASHHCRWGSGNSSSNSIQCCCCFAAKDIVAAAAAAVDMNRTIGPMVSLCPSFLH